MMDSLVEFLRYYLLQLRRVWWQVGVCGILVFLPLALIIAWAYAYVDTFDTEDLGRAYRSSMWLGCSLLVPVIFMILVKDEELRQDQLAQAQAEAAALPEEDAVPVAEPPPDLSWKTWWPRLASALWQGLRRFPRMLWTRWLAQVALVIAVALPLLLLAGILSSTGLDKKMDTTITLIVYGIVATPLAAYVWLRLFFVEASYLLLDESGIGAIRQSWHLTRRHQVPIAVAAVVGHLLALAVATPFFILALWLMYGFDELMLEPEYWAIQAMAWTPLTVPLGLLVVYQYCLYRNLVWRLRIADSVVIS